MVYISSTHQTSNIRFKFQHFIIVQVYLDLLLNQLISFIWRWIQKRSRTTSLLRIYYIFCFDGGWVGSDKIQGMTLWPQSVDAREWEFGYGCWLDGVWICILNGDQGAWDFGCLTIIQCRCCWLRWPNLMENNQSQLPQMAVTPIFLGCGSTSTTTTRHYFNSYSSTIEYGESISWSNQQILSFFFFFCFFFFFFFFFSPFGRTNIFFFNQAPWIR